MDNKGYRDAWKEKERAKSNGRLAINDHPVPPRLNGLDDFADVEDLSDWEMRVGRSLKGENDRSGGAEGGCLVDGFRRGRRSRACRESC